VRSSKDQIVTLQLERPKDSTPEDQPDVVNVLEALGNASIKDALLPVERGPGAVATILRDKLLHDMSPPSPSILRGMAFPKAMKCHLFKPSAAQGAGLIDRRLQRSTLAVIQVNAASPFVNRDRTMPDGLEEPGFLPGPGSIPNMLPFELMSQGQDSTPLLLNRVGDDVAFTKKFPTMLGTVVHEGNPARPPKTTRILGELVNSTVEEINLELSLLLTSGDGLNTGPMPGASGDSEGGIIMRIPWSKRLQSLRVERKQSLGLRSHREQVNVIKDRPTALDADLESRNLLHPSDSGRGGVGFTKIKPQPFLINSSGTNAVSKAGLLLGEIASCSGPSSEFCSVKAEFGQGSLRRDEVLVAPCVLNVLPALLVECTSMSFREPRANDWENFGEPKRFAQDSFKSPGH
jgi:hypothetical protein